MYKLSRDEYRKIKTMSKETMERWLSNRNASMYESLRKIFEKEYQDEVDSSINNFLVAIAYTLTFTEEIKIEKGAIAGVIEDLLVTVDMFRTGEYKPKDYEEALKENGVTFEPYDYTKMYRKKKEDLLTPIIKVIGNCKTKVFDMEPLDRDKILDMFDGLDNIIGGELNGGNTNSSNNDSSTALSSDKNNKRNTSNHK